MSTGSSTREARESTGGAELHWPELFEQALELPPPFNADRRHWWGRAGVSSRGEHVFDFTGSIALFVLAIGWIWSIANARSLTSIASPSSPLSSARAAIASALPSSGAPTAAYVTDAALSAITDRILESARGASGKLRAVIQPAPAPITPDTLPPGAQLEYARGSDVSTAPKAAGVWRVLLALGNAVRPIANFNVITMLPFSAKQNGKVGLYFVGTWPSEKAKVGPKQAPPSAYANPAGFIEVTQQNVDTPVSEHFKLGDFLTHDQPNVWPKYMVLQQRLIDKLELVLADLQAHGIDIRGVKVMSGFRTPQYNYTGGNTGGRANLSRHMYGDAADIYIDSNGDGQMDDLNHDGRISIDDSRVISAAVDRVEAANPQLVGGAGVYTAAPGHGPFIHIDTRGYRARWSGTSGG
jgi:hypothetical protein